MYLASKEIVHKPINLWKIDWNIALLKLKHKVRPVHSDYMILFELFWKHSSYVSGVSVCIFVALYVQMFVARANKVEGTMSWCLGTNEILASI